MNLDKTCNRPKCFEPAIISRPLVCGLHLIEYLRKKKVKIIQVPINNASLTLKGSNE